MYNKLKVLFKLSKIPIYTHINLLVLPSAKSIHEKDGRALLAAALPSTKQWVDLFFDVFKLQGRNNNLSNWIRKKSIKSQGKISRHDLGCAIASCELRCAVASCDVRVRTQFFEACNVRACGTFLDLRCAITILHVLKKKLSFFLV